MKYAFALATFAFLGPVNLLLDTDSAVVMTAKELKELGKTTQI